MNKVIQEDYEEDECPYAHAPPGSFKDKHGYWRRPGGTILPGQDTLKLTRQKSGSSNRALFKEVCQTYSIEGLSAINDLFWDPATDDETKLKIQIFFTKYGFGNPASAPEDLKSATENSKELLESLRGITLRGT